MTSVEYTKLPQDMQARVFDAACAVLAEDQVRTGEKQPLGQIKLGSSELEAADRFVAGSMEKDGFVRFGPGVLALDPTAFSASMRTLGAYMSAHAIDTVTASDAKAFFTATQAGSLMLAAVEAALGQDHQ